MKKSQLSWLALSGPLGSLFDGAWSKNKRENVSMETYKIVRFFQNPEIGRRTVETGLTLEEAQAHCKNPETSSRTATSAHAKKRTANKGAWFDGYEQE
jgi:hypothetical protein